MTEERDLLPASVLPSEYDLVLVPDFERFTYKGDVDITVEVHEPTAVVVLHSNELAYFGAKFVGADGTKLEATTIATRSKDETVHFTFDSSLPKGSGTLSISFQGVHNDKMAGFYRSKYTTPKGETKHMVTTQFEPADARRAFPCWDEPARKAVFKVTMVVPAELMALSNMPEARRELQKDGTVRVTFMKSPKMSTYLLAFIVGEFDYIQGQTKNGTLVRVLSIPGKVHECEMALGEGIAYLEFYEDYFGIRFPLPKLDMIGVPDFSAGAMENWGLVTYREVDLLLDSKAVSAARRQRVALVIAHEIAHQWFGNLVTMQWWDNLWLNEGFASWMENNSRDHLHPEWLVWEEFVDMTQQRGIDLDSLRSSHPVQVPIRNVSEVEQVFDLISYNKGAGMVRIVHAMLGAEKFRTGLQKYLSQHAYGNTVSDDLWGAWEAVSEAPVSRVMNAWTKTTGFPLLSVEAGSGGKIKVSQAYFVADGSKQDGDEEKKWPVPLFIGGKEAVQGYTLLEDKSMEIDRPQGFFKLNYGQHVPLRVLYSDELFRELSGSIHLLDPVDKIGLLGDTAALAKAGKVCPSQILVLLAGFVEHPERNDKVWSKLSTTLQLLYKAFKKAAQKSGEGSKAAKTLKAFESLASKLVKPVFEEIGWDNREEDSDNTLLLRMTIVSLVSVFCGTEPEVKAEAKRRFDAFVADQSTPLLRAEIRGSVFSIVSQAFSEEVFPKLQAIHNGSEDGSLRQICISGLAQGPQHLKVQAFHWGLGDDVRQQDKHYTMAAIGRSQSHGGGGELIFDLIRDNYDRVSQLIQSHSIFLTVVKISGMFLLSTADADKYAEFWASKDLAYTKMGIQQTVESVRVLSGFVDSVEKALESGNFEAVLAAFM